MIKKEDEFMGVTNGVWTDIIADIVDAYQTIRSMGIGEENETKCMLMVLSIVHEIYDYIPDDIFKKFCVKVFVTGASLLKDNDDVVAIRACDLLKIIEMNWDK